MTAAEGTAPSTTGYQEVALYLGARVVTLLVSLGSQSVLAWFLGADGRGEYAVCVTFAVVAGLLFTLSVDKGSLYHVTTGGVRLPQGIASVLAVTLAGSALVALLATPLVGSGTLFFKQASASAFQLALVLVPLVYLTSALEVQLTGLRRFGWLAIVLPARAAIVVALTVVLVWAFDGGVNGALLALVAGHGLTTVASLWYCRRRCGLTFEAPSFGICAHLLGYGLRYHPAQMGNFLDSRLGILVLGVIATRADVGDIGVFAVASAIMLSFGIPAEVIGTVLFPRSAGVTGERHGLFGLCLRLACGVTAAGLALFVLLSAPLVRVFFSEQFLGMVPLIRIIAPGILALAATSILSTYFLASGRPHVCSWGSWIGIVVNVGALIAFYPLFGLEGAAWAMTLGLLVEGLFLAVVFHRATAIPLASAWLPRASDVGYLWRSGRLVLGQAYDWRRTVGV